jgi:putative nucleotidyltransferase with HDIG domain
MSTGGQKRQLLDRTGSFSLPPSPWAQMLNYLQHVGVLLRIGACLLAAVMMWWLTSGWTGSFPFRRGYIPDRDIVASVQFAVRDPEATKRQREQARRETLCVYSHDRQQLAELRKALEDKVFQLIGAASFESLEKSVWDEFFVDDKSADSERKAPADISPLFKGMTEEDVFKAFQESFTGDMKLASFELAIERAFQRVEEDGLLENLGHQLEDGSQIAILVHPRGNPKLVHQVEVRDVRIAGVAGLLTTRVTQEINSLPITKEQSSHVAVLVNQWLQHQRLPVTLELNLERTEQEYETAMDRIGEARLVYRPGDRLAEGGKPLSSQDLELLRFEYQHQREQAGWGRMVSCSLAFFGMYGALYVLCGCYILFHEPRILNDFRHLTTILSLVVITGSLMHVAARDDWRVEIVPITLFAMTITIAYHRELGLLLAAAVSLVHAVSQGSALTEWLILLSAVAASVLMLARIRSRTKLIYVGLCTGVVVILTTIGVGTLVGQMFGASDVSMFSTMENAEVVWNPQFSFVSGLIQGAFWYGGCALTAGFLMTGLLPVVEWLFDVQTDISLLELGDAAHPLLQELSRRAPGTYNHSMNVASLGEAAAAAIGANSLLVRVGAYFHDIGKMLKPEYFVENQVGDDNRHESLLPAMSSLVIIAHVKDGADLAEHHNLPQPIIDFIEQHHGTTLVEFFYIEATKRSQDDPNGVETDEANFRYPGPKPQSREAGIMMLADAVESASRSLEDPAPARIEGLVRKISKKRLDTGQFHDCGLTLQELHAIENSLIKSLAAVHHGRVKYPDQEQTA